MALGLLAVLATACGGDDTATSDPLAGTKWEMTSVRDGGVTKPASPTTIATLVLEDGTARGSTGCNLFLAGYSIDGTSITFGDLSLTGSACDPEYVGQGDAVVQALQASNRYTVSDDRLRLKDAEGTVQLEFRPATELPLAGITWRLSWYGEGTSPLDATEITLAFRPDDTLVGVAGCNEYSAAYRLDGDELTIGVITHTKRRCLEPDGVMSQEAGYLDTIRRSSSFATTLTALELLDAGGIPIAEYRFGGRTRDTGSG